MAPADADKDIVLALGQRQVDHYELIRPEGQSYTYSTTGQPMSAISENNYTLQKTASGFKVDNGLLRELYDATGRLVSIETAGAPILSLSYDPQGNLYRVSDSRGYILEFGTGANGLIWNVNALGTGAVANYGYENVIDGPRMTSAAGAQGTQKFHYENSSFPTYLTGISDRNNVRYATWTYNAQGQAKSSEHAGGVEQVSLVFSQDAGGLLRYTDETDVLGTTRRYTFKSVGGHWRLVKLDQPGGAGCQAAFSSVEYNSNGSLRSRTDFRGTVTTFVIDPVTNLETSRTEAVGTPYERTITTRWNATLRLPDLISEPKRTTQIDYNSSTGRPNWVEVTDTSSSPTVKRRTSYSYTYWDSANRHIKQIIIDGPRTDADDRTFYDYDERGNLLRMTQKSGTTDLVTSWEQYDSGGRPAIMTAPSNVKTYLKYDGRGLIISRIVGYGGSTPLTTIYRYYDFGALQKVIFPDSTTVEYLYDAARRLTDIRDNKGNYIHYTLDKAGNRKEETVNDTAAALAGLLRDIDLALTAQQPRVEGL